MYYSFYMQYFCAKCRFVGFKHRQTVSGFAEAAAVPVKINCT